MYEECVKCNKIGVSCDGPNFVAMAAPDVLAWCKARKAHLHLTNAQLAELSSVPKGTVDRLFAGEHVDFRFESIRPIVRALIGGDWSGSPCPIPPNEELEVTRQWREDKLNHLTGENKHLQKELDDANVRHKESQDFMRAQVKRKDRAIAILAIVLGIALIYIIVTLIIDRLDPTRGHWWLESLLNVPQSITEKFSRNG